MKGAARKIVAPIARPVVQALDRRLRLAVAAEVASLRDDMRSDLATMAELAIELERQAERIERAVASQASHRA